MAKTSKSGKANRKLVSGGVTVVIVAVILIVVCFFTFISGVLPRTFTGVKITETLPDGSTNTVKNFSVLETNFHFKEVFDTYSQYGMVSEDTLDNVVNPETGETYRDALLREAATQMRTLALVERSAKESGFMPMSKAREVAAQNLQTLDFYATLYGFPSGQAYLKALYGTGTSKRAYTDFAARETLVQEYGSYVKQFDTSVVPTDAEVQAKHDENPNQYSVVDYSVYFCKAETDDEGNVIGMDKAVEAAKKITKAAKDTESFRQAALDYVTDKKDEAAITSFADGKDPCLTEGFTYTSAGYMDAKIKDYLFGDCKTGDTTVIETEFGAYAIYIAEKTNNDYDTVTFRMLTLSAKTNKKDPTDEDKAAALNKTIEEAKTLCPSGMDPLSFYKLVKEHSTDLNSMLDGGYKSGLPTTYFVSTEEDPLDSAVVEAGKWLFDSSRKQGDTLVIPSQDGETVYVFYYEATRPAWDAVIRNEIITENFSAWNGALEKNSPGYVINAGLVKYLVY